jgi:hypothetical protein
MSKRAKTAAPPEPKRMDHKIAVHMKTDKIKISVDQLVAMTGDRVKWESRGPEVFMIRFVDRSPFGDDLELTPDELVGYKLVINEGPFKYEVWDFPPRARCLDPGIVVDPPTP